MLSNVLLCFIYKNMGCEKKNEIKNWLSYTVKLIKLRIGGQQLD